MFNSDNNEEKKLDWMYKGPHSTVDREEYLLGRSVDKTLEQINDEEKQKQSGVSAPKNRVEHECIPPSIRDVNKVVETVQVDLSAKLQEDPLVAIQKRMEESRREFLQNPVQLKKLQQALESQQAKKHKKKKKKKKSGDKNLEFNDKMELLKNGLLGSDSKNRKVDQEETDLDTILIHKFNALKGFLTDQDLRDVLSCEVSGGSSDEDEGKQKNQKYNGDSSEVLNSSEDEQQTRKYNKPQPNKEWRNSSRRPREDRRRPSSIIEKRRRNDSSDSDSFKPKRNWGLVTSDGSKIALNKKSDNKSSKKDSVKKPEQAKPIQKNYKAKKMTDEEKDKLRREMMVNAQWRDKEREKNVRRYRESDEKEKKTEKDFDPEFAHKQLLKTTASSSVESRIKANVNKIQRSSRDMEKHFSRR